VELYDSNFNLPGGISPHSPSHGWIKTLIQSYRTLRLWAVHVLHQFHKLIARKLAQSRDVACLALLSVQYLTTQWTNIVLF